MNLKENKVICSCGHFMRRWYSRQHNSESCRLKFYPILKCHHCGRREFDSDELPSDLTILPTRSFRQAHQIYMTKRRDLISVPH